MTLDGTGDGQGWHYDHMHECDEHYKPEMPHPSYDVFKTWRWNRACFQLDEWLEYELYAQYNNGDNRPYGSYDY